MRATLGQFTGNSSLQASSESLLKKLGIKYSALLRGVPFDDYFKQRGFNYQYVKELEQSLEHIWNIGYVNNTTFEVGEASDQNAKYPGLCIFACEIKPEVSFTRSMAVALTRAFNRASTQLVNNSYDMPVIVIMRQGSMLSLATCERSDRQDGHGEKVGRVAILRDMNCSNLHAGHKQILDRIKENVRGCRSYEELHRKWFESFNIDILSDNFFMGYKNIYEDIIEYITGKRMVKESSKWVERDNKKPNVEIMAEFAIFEDPEKAVRDYVKKLLGRLVFIQFLQKKGWMGVPAGESWVGGDPDFLQNLFRASAYKDDFVDMVLEPLFKDLNTPRDNDLVSDYNVHHGNQIKVPYLNGGLFEVSSSDSLRFKIPGRYFWNDDEGEAEKHPGILRLFSNYNFTIDENAPDDVEIGVDPEMLSRIFENLLEDNKEKGAYYTPKEIVNYMCRESLIAYLQTNKTEEEKEAICSFVRTGNADVLEETLKTEIADKLKTVKICDPAIGSGAFPMGMLKELYTCTRALKGPDDDNAAEVKKHIIQHNIYGVDIEKGAVDIARLRFWLSIVVDEKTPHALPNMDFKIMRGDSLIPTFDGKYVNLTDKLKHVNSNKIRDAKKRLYALQNGYYTSEGDSKLELLIQIKCQILEIVKLQMDYEYQQEIEDSAETMNLFNPEPCKDIKIDEDKRRVVGLCLKLQRELTASSKSLGDRASIEIPFFDWKVMFSDVFSNDKEGFDIVIGNPPYIKEGRVSSLYFQPYKKSSYYQGKMDIWYMFACNGLDLLNANGLLCFIATNNWTTSAGAGKLRDKVISETRICNLVDFGAAKMFESASIQTMIMMFQKDSKSDNYAFDYRKLIARKASREEGIALLDKTSKVAEYYSPTISRKSIKGKNITFSQNNDILKKILMKTGVIFLNKKELTNGIHPHFDFINKKLSEKHGFTIGEGVFGLLNSEIGSLSLNELESGPKKPYYNSSDKVIRYIVYDTDLKIIYTNSTFKDPRSMDAYPHLKARLDRYSDVITSDNKPYGLHRARVESFFKGEKIVALRKCNRQPIFAYANGEHYMSATFYVIQTERVCMKYLTCLLNSRLVEFWLRNKGKMQGANYQLDKGPLQQIPIVVASEETQSEMAQILDTIIKVKSEDVNADISNYERRINAIVYELYGLSDTDIQIIEGDLRS